MNERFKFRQACLMRAEKDHNVLSAFVAENQKALPLRDAHLLIEAQAIADFIAADTLEHALGEMPEGKTSGEYTIASYSEGDNKSKLVTYLRALLRDRLIAGQFLGTCIVPEEGVFRERAPIARDHWCSLEMDFEDSQVIAADAIIGTEVTIEHSPPRNKKAEMADIQREIEKIVAQRGILPPREETIELVTSILPYATHRQVREAIKTVSPSKRDETQHSKRD
jgi:hypothetical protein